MMKLSNNLTKHSESLVHNLDSNIAESFNSLVAKMTGGKRINFSQRNG